jgi:omega-6 fatty acid desaturase (delta-12 desaturase)
MQEDVLTPGQVRRADFAAWKATVSRYQESSLARTSWQLANSLGMYALLWVLMYFSLGVSWWLTLPLAVLAGGLLIRVFIIFHDCGHGSAFKSQRANSFWGFVCGVATFTPYQRWRWEHARHHATSGNLDRRGIGDIWTMTIDEYRASPRWQRVAYRIVRNPLVLFLIGPMFLMLVMERVPTSNGNRKERHSVWWTNLALLVMVAGLIQLFGLVPYLVIQLGIIAVAGSAGVWLFYIQHQYEDAYWARGEDWDYVDAALDGSSYYRLPVILQWFSGNIGFHHIHHLNPRIPNYYLEKCLESAPDYLEVTPITLRSSLKSMSLRLWDESERKLVSFRALRSGGH